MCGKAYLIFLSYTESHVRFGSLGRLLGAVAHFWQLQKLQGPPAAVPSSKGLKSPNGDCFHMSRESHVIRSSRKIQGDHVYSFWYTDYALTQGYVHFIWVHLRIILKFMSQITF